MGEGILYLNLHRHVTNFNILQTCEHLENLKTFLIVSWRYILIILLNEEKTSRYVLFGDLENMHVPEWLVTSFNMKRDNKSYEYD